MRIRDERDRNSDHYVGNNTVRVDWCRRGDSNPHELPHTPLKRARLPVPPLRHLGERFSLFNVRYASACREMQTKLVGKINNRCSSINERSRLPSHDKLKHIGHESRFQHTSYFLLADGDAAGAVAGAVVAAGAGCCVGDGDGVAVGALSGFDCKTEREPVSVGNDSIKATSMNAAAAPIVIFASRLAVPRGPKAVLERLLEKSAPASALPGCRRMLTIKTTQDNMNRPYKM